MQVSDDDDFFDFGDEPAPGEAGAESEVRLPPRLGLLANLTPDQFDAVARSAKLCFKEPGQVVCAQGDEADRFFILVDGQVQVERDGVPLAMLAPGSFFGESALLVGGRRSASVVTIDASALWSVCYEVFDKVVSQHLLADEDARREVHARLRETPPGHFT